MPKLSLLRTVIRSNPSFFTVRADKNGLSSLLLRESPRFISTEAENQPPKDPPVENSFLETPGTGLVYGKLYGITRNTLKTDIVNLLEGCNLTLEDVKVDYSRSFTPLGMMVQFPSRQAYEQAARVISRRGRLNRLERADRSQWDILTPYDGKTVLLQGIPRNAVPEDVERFLSGCQYDSSSIQIFLRAAYPDPIKMATIRFPSQTEAMNAFITKNRAFCLNSQVTVRVLQ
ncbi:hypothetical protein FEM48_Zijuj12G0176300 [Ziziphus jujuba var. spinosa]|uniref:Uncharacterized protein n=1 Tax=Ziziphus jujuba var. spinosa TaxID=714518 RepID=A0A978UEP8_ZIZJJ|nr:uncharacterized protein LOC125419239 [Ziziphus jujuba var. spinosa]KAH7513241.1 hypothetical protein FEM48_Zijuj12G0176300 [Ziziphus jujuba var. spinosa]